MRYVVGIDEVGRGCLAGPVTVAAFAVPENSQFKAGKLKLRDSKKLSAEQRERWVRYLDETDAIYEIQNISPKIIDRINISAAANLAAHKAIQRLMKTIGKMPQKIYLDGGLYIKNKKHQAEFFSNASTVVKGDEKIEAVSLASIVAKVSRDKYMARLSKLRPGYSFDAHKGYATMAHRAAIRKLGLSPSHRLTFTRKYNNI